MGISVDVKKIEKLEALEEVLGLLQNPESYTRLIAEVQHATKAYHDMTAKFATIEAAEGYLADARVALARAKESAKAIEEDVAKRKAAFDTMVAVKTVEIDTALAAASQAQKIALKELTQAKAVRELADKERAELEEYRQVTLKQLEEMEVASRAKKKQLDEKLAAFKQLAGS